MERIQYPASKFSFCMQVEDEHCKWNNGVFKISGKNNTISVEKVEKAQIDFSLDIRSLSQLVAGFRSAQELLEMNRISAEGNLEEITTLFPKEVNFLRDFF